MLLAPDIPLLFGDSWAAAFTKAFEVFFLFGYTSFTPNVAEGSAMRFVDVKCLLRHSVVCR